MGLKQGIIPKTELKSVNELADVFKTFSTNLKFIETYEGLRKACKLCETGMEHIMERYPDLKEALKTK